ncbi:SGNH/GDSL hydrolase family protein [Undibacterium rugosum]|uniref:SGNH/GDSL hydrolase family protein n=1 Tax=Undibacterium rugosum TaxID=2762291 RepID=A0A923KZ36_9BURK|nr:SGNH/GDSL hydrolase family protein [Undibacterium rugosum]MBC3935435.1 SGNH/GDSL hydrolase family protein [Undibacterium rugosum]MBR7778790.1 SGNH/GDSL hydrolase family protein [Undibacterium rugosum]
MRKSTLSCLTALFLLLPQLSQAAGLAQVVDYGDPHIHRVWRQMAALERGESKDVLRIMQFGDSHTGGDYFTHAFRDRMQQRFGNAGIGWITPGYVKNQRSAQVLMKMAGNWKTRIARANPENFPVGGVANLPDSGAYMEIQPKFPVNGPLRVSVWSRRSSDVTSGGWRIVMPDGEQRELAAPLSQDWQVSYVYGAGNEQNSFFLRADETPAELGGIVIDALAPGVTVDALGVVGAMQRVILRWQPEALRDQLRWRKPDLLILSYGTNEAFDVKPDFEAYYNDLQTSVRNLRAAAPQAAILLIGAPNSARKTGPGEQVGCRYKIPAALRNVQTIQKQIAIEEKLLYWDWEKAMGGACSIQRYAAANPPLAGQDLIHFTEDGYERSGADFYESFIQLYQRGRKSR